MERVRDSSVITVLCFLNINTTKIDMNTEFIYMPSKDVLLAGFGQQVRYPGREPRGGEWCSAQWRGVTLRHVPTRRIGWRDTWQPNIQSFLGQRSLTSAENVERSSNFLICYHAWLEPIGPETKVLRPKIDIFG